MSVFIIAEAGVNHNGSLKNALRMVDVAADCGANAIKFQTFKSEDLVSKTARKASYQINSESREESQYEMLKSLELDIEAHQMILKHCEDRKIMFLSSPFDEASIDLLLQLNMEIFKIPSGEITNFPYLRRIGSLNRKIILSTGMATLGEISSALNVITEAGCEKSNITILHANTMYPTPMEDANLSAILTLKKEFGLAVGYSDHTLGIEAPIAAIAMGAQMLEKHFTLDKDMIGPDHKASLNPEELCSMVKAVRNIEGAIGSGHKAPSASERPNIDIVRKSIFAAKPIQKGEIITESHLTTKRPGNGINPMKWNSLVGTIAIKSYCAGEML